MAYINNVILIGNLGTDPGFQTFGSSKAKESPEWHRVVPTGHLAQIAGECHAAL